MLGDGFKRMGHFVHIRGSVQDTLRRMVTLTYVEAREKLASLLDSVVSSREAVLIKRRGHPGVAMLPANEKVVERVLKLLEEIRRDPFRGTGKPEPLKHPVTRVRVAAGYAGGPVGLPSGKGDHKFAAMQISSLTAF